jgi:Putative peptidoglycan binding domain
MKAKTILSLASLLVCAAVGEAVAAGHGGGGGGFGGGGFHGGGGGGFTGGGFHGGGFSGGVAGGVGNRGGGVGFGGMRVPGRVPSFEGAGPRFSTFGHPSHVQPQPGRSLIQAPRPVVARQSEQRFSNLRNHVVARHDANWHGDWDRRRAHFDHGRFFVFIDGFWCGLDAGFFPWDYLPYYPNDYYPYDYYTDADPYDYNSTNYDIDPADSATVQAVQADLARLGYYNGSIDGVFGPSTRDAVARYQIANQLTVTGSLSPDTLQSLGLPQVTPS